MEQYTHVVTHPLTEAEILQIHQAMTACPGMIYQSTDTNMIWVGAPDGSLIGPFVTVSGIISQGVYPNDTVAGNGGVQPNQYYTLSKQNSYGMPGGTVKQRVE
ncbi:MAG: hypothetical protein AAFU67_00355 [Bacteroidota bacterium]